MKPIFSLILFLQFCHPQLSWQTLRVEARSTRDQGLTPLRLITNQARCRITIKKRLAGELRPISVVLVSPLRNTLQDV